MNFIEVAKIILERGVPLRFFALKKDAVFPWDVERSCRKASHNNAELIFNPESLIAKVGEELDRKFLRKKFNSNAYVSYPLVLLLLDEQPVFATSCAAFELMFPEFNFEPAAGTLCRDLQMEDIAFQTITSRHSLRILWEKTTQINLSACASIIERNSLNILFRALGQHNFRPLVAKLLRKYNRNKKAVEAAKGIFSTSP